jgi:hypothetical protein
MNPIKYTKEYRNAALRKWRQEHPERAKEHARKGREQMNQRHPGYSNQKSQEWKKRNQEQRRAVDAVHNHFYKLTGVCSQCGSTDNLERHHEDYTKPLEFVVLCRKCHRTLHHKPFEETLAKAGYAPKPHLRELPLEVDLNERVMVLNSSEKNSEAT